MKRSAAFMLLAALSFAWPALAGAQIFRGKDSVRQAEKAGKKGQKARDKTARKQQKAMRKYQKAQRKAAKRQQRRAG
jgi:hypothetical protein